MVSKEPHFILLGPPGSGKGTQAKILARETGYRHLSTGDLIRDQIKAKSSLGLKIKKIVELGDFPKDDIVVDLVSTFVNSCSTGIIFDGFPRTLSQAGIFLKMLSSEQRKSIFAVRIDVPESALIERLTKRYMCEACGAIYSDDLPLKEEGHCDSCGETSFIRRKDDQEEAVGNRLSVYMQQTKPMLQFLSEKLPFFVVDGLQSPEKVTFDILKALDKEKKTYEALG